MTAPAALAGTGCKANAGFTCGLSVTVLVAGCTERFATGRAGGFAAAPVGVEDGSGLAGAFAFTVLAGEPAAGGASGCLVTAVVPG